MKRFNIRDGMGVERLRTLVQVDVGIISGEASPALERRAAKLGIHELHLGIKDKKAVLDEILRRRGLELDQVAYIGDDVNDVAGHGSGGIVGLSGRCHGICPRGCSRRLHDGWRRRCPA